MMFLLLCLTLPEATCEVLEKNHMHNPAGQHTSTQMIVWRDDHVDWWQFCDPVVTRHGDEWRCVVWHEGRMWRIRAKTYRETWTQWDPERLDLERWPADRRGGL